MSMIHRHFRCLLITIKSVFVLTLLVGCANHPLGGNNQSAVEETDKQLQENLPGNIYEPIVEFPHEKENLYEEPMDGERRLENVELHDLDFSSGGHEVREFENDNSVELSMPSNPVLDLIVDPGICNYIASINVNCRVSDYPESTLIAVLMQGEVASLLYLNPTFTHGKFDLLNSSQCWIPLSLMDGPSDPLAMCEVYVVDAPPLRGDLTIDDSDSSVCASGLDEATCIATGGSWVDGGAVGASYCDCS